MLNRTRGNSAARRLGSSVKHQTGAHTVQR